MPRSVDLQICKDHESIVRGWKCSVIGVGNEIWNLSFEASIKVAGTFVPFSFQLHQRCKVPVNVPNGLQSITSVKGIYNRYFTSNKLYHVVRDLFAERFFTTIQPTSRYNSTKLKRNVIRIKNQVASCEEQTRKQNYMHVLPGCSFYLLFYGLRNPWRWSAGMTCHWSSCWAHAYDNILMLTTEPGSHTYDNIMT